jgi:hypothetical protein
VHCDTIRPCQLGNPCRKDRIRLYGSAGLTDGGNVINIDPKVGIVKNMEILFRKDSFAKTKINIKNRSDQLA